MGEIRQVDGPKILPRGYGKTLPSPPLQYEWEARPYFFHEFPKAMLQRPPAAARRHGRLPRDRG